MHVFSNVTNIVGIFARVNPQFCEFKIAKGSKIFVAKMFTFEARQSHIKSTLVLLIEPCEI